MGEMSHTMGPLSLTDGTDESNEYRIRQMSFTDISGGSHTEAQQVVQRGQMCHTEVR